MNTLEPNFIDYTNEMPRSGAELALRDRYSTINAPVVAATLGLLLSARYSDTRTRQNIVENIKDDDYYLQEMTQEGSRIFLATTADDQEGITSSNVLGAALLREESIYGVRRGVLEAMAVAKESRGQGVARFIFTHVCGYATQQNYSYILLEARPGTELLYENFGAGRLLPLSPVFRYPTEGTLRQPVPAMTNQSSALVY